ncbi:MAG: hypothetical protein AAB649_01900, partial [Patescibacteria group bacterium]
MNKYKQCFFSFTLVAILVTPLLASAQVTVVSADTAIRASGQSDALYQDCKIVKQINSEADDVQTLDLRPEHKDLSLVRFTKFSIVEETIITTNITYYACPAEVVAKIQTNSETSSLTAILRMLVNMLEFLISILNYVLTEILSWAGYLLVLMIGQGKFITSDIVTQAWPFVQGIANLGFIFALLYIALATTLRLESVSTSIQRLLPRLLIAALLVNFSLVIGGLIIDASRLVMAAEIKLMGNGTLDYDNFAAELVKSSNATAAALSSMTEVKMSNASALVFKMIQSSLFLGLLTAAMLIVAINLFIRYIALLVLLILSPMAYLAFALPKTSQYATQWWGMFIKWVLYGPIVLFFLIIITRIQNVNIVLAETEGGNKLFTVFFNQFIHFAIIIALFFVANSVGKKVAGVGSDAVMGFAKKNPRAALLTGLAVGTGGLATPVAAMLGYKAAKVAGTGAKNAGRDILSNAGSNLKQSKMVKPVRDFLGMGKRDKEGNLLPGKSSWGSNLAGTLTDRFNTSKQNDINAVKALGTITTTNINNIALAPSQLKKSHVASSLGETNIKMIMEEGSQAQ